MCRGNRFGNHGVEILDAPIAGIEAIAFGLVLVLVSLVFRSRCARRNGRVRRVRRAWRVRRANVEIVVAVASIPAPPLRLRARFSRAAQSNGPAERLELDVRATIAERERD